MKNVDSKKIISALSRLEKKNVANPVENIISIVSRLEENLLLALSEIKNLKTQLSASPAKEDCQLDDLIVNFNPNKWTGESQIGNYISKCPVSFLELYAMAMDWCANHPRPGKAKFTDKNRKDAELIRKWVSKKYSLGETANKPNKVTKHYDRYMSSAIASEYDREYDNIGDVYEGDLDGWNELVEY